jgi:hydrogenase maturation protease
MTSTVRRVADAVLYEGYMLYPYRHSSVKNRQRWTFGSLFPEAYASDPSAMHTEMLIVGSTVPSVTVHTRFLHLVSRKTAEGAWQEAMDREITTDFLGAYHFRFPASQNAGALQKQIDGIVKTSIETLDEGLFRLVVDVVNTTKFDRSSQVSRDEASMQALVAAHAIAEVRQGDFISLTDPPEQYCAAAQACRNSGVWPVLLGNDGSHDCMLASPIILSDYPQVAPESPGDLFDCTEIDEILTLRILTLTDAEKAEMRAADARTRFLLERTESLGPDELRKLHGALRNPHAMGRVS